MKIALLFLCACAYSVRSGSIFNDTFNVWSPPVKGLSCSTGKVFDVTDYAQCSEVCERISKSGGNCKAISYEVTSKKCHLCDGYFTTQSNSTAIYSYKFLARTISNGQIAILAPEGNDFQLGSALNSCNYYAKDSDTQKAGLGAVMKNACQKEFGHSPDATHVNGDSYPYKMCLMAQTAIWTGLSPSAGQSVVASDSYTNSLPQSVSHTFSLNGNFDQSMSLSTTSTVSWSETVEYSVGIPDVLSEKFSMTTGMSSAKTQSHSSSSAASYTSSTTVDMKSGQSMKASMKVETSIYNSHFSVPICLKGYFRCQFGSRVKGHFYWYLPIENYASKSQLCVRQTGQMGASISIKAHTTVSPA